ncbi:MAG TPA: hypothetical protein VFH29_06455, partial [Anaerolineales bacterium]|nr:hypothetical protein [Anaerolineales bacterium]
ILIPVFVAWVSDSNMTHISEFGLHTSVILLVLMLAPREQNNPALSHAFEWTGSILLALTLVPGIVLLGIQLTAGPIVVLSEHYGDAEARFMQQAWGRVPAGSKILGQVGPASTLTGVLTAGIWQIPPGDERPVWEEMLSAPRLQTLLDHNFDFVYVDSRWWKSLGPASQRELQAGCISIFAKGEAFEGGNMAELLDLRGCR